jgi:hypothetical protein
MVLGSAQLNSLPAKAVGVTASNANMTSLGFLFTVCFSETTSEVLPIKDLEECYTAVLPLYSEGPMNEPVSWTSQRIWRFHSCMVVLEPIPRPIRADTFPRNAIVYAIAQIALACITEARRNFGGFLRIGTGLFMVIVRGIPTASVLESKEIPRVDPPKRISANLNQRKETSHHLRIPSPYNGPTIGQPQRYQHSLSQHR